MIQVAFMCFCLAAGLSELSSLRTLDKRPHCNQQGLDNCKISKYLICQISRIKFTQYADEQYNIHTSPYMPEDCSDKHPFVIRPAAPTGPEWDPEQVGVWMDKGGLVPVVNVTWMLRSDASILKLSGTEIKIVDENTSQSMCVQFSYKFSKQLNPESRRWKFSLDGVLVEPGHTYMVSAFNLPEPEIGHYRIKKQIFIPGCSDRRIQRTQICLQNGSLWDPHMTTNVSVDREHKILTISMGFKAAQYSERYQVTIQSHGFYDSKNVSKENRTSLNVTFEFGLWQLSQCEMFLIIQPFFTLCKNDCWQPKKTIDYCQYYPPRTLFTKAALGLLLIGSCLIYLLWRASRKDPVNTSTFAAKEQPESYSVKKRKRVLIIYSLDHKLYKNIVLKLCAFLGAKCGTEVVLDLLDSTRLGLLGSIQWLDWHREQIKNSSDKLIILCSRGVQAKWRAMCGDRQVFLKEDAYSPIGDMLSPALGLIVPHFIRSASFEKYIIAYFDSVCSEEDVPSPFNITVRYKLMKQFEELFFRILDTEKQKPGRVNHIQGISENEYHHCPSGRALKDAIEAFHAYQLENPHWFEDELLENSEV